MISSIESHPVWVRGLKPFCGLMNISQIWSHPVWVRGLKPKCKREPHHARVAPRVGAWIETLAFITKCNLRCVAPRVGAWIETR